MNINKRCLSEKEAAEYIGMSVSYLRKDRMNGNIGNRAPGPSYVKIGRAVRYAIEDLDQWINSNKINQALLSDLTQTF